MAFKFESTEFKRAFEKILELSRIRNTSNVIGVQEYVKEIARDLEKVKRVFPLDGNLSKLDEIISYSTEQEGFDFVARTKEVIIKYNSSISDENYSKIILLSSALIYIYLREYEFKVGGFHPSIGIEIGAFIATVGIHLKK